MAGIALFLIFFFPLKVESSREGVIIRAKEVFKGRKCTKTCDLIFLLLSLINSFFSSLFIKNPTLGFCPRTLWPLPILFSRSFHFSKNNLYFYFFPIFLFLIVRLANNVHDILFHLQCTSSRHLKAILSHAQRFLVSFFFFHFLLLLSLHDDSK